MTFEKTKTASAIILWILTYKGELDIWMDTKVECIFPMVIWSGIRMAHAAWGSIEMKNIAKTHLILVERLNLRPEIKMPYVISCIVFNAPWSDKMV